MGFFYLSAASGVCWCCSFISDCTLYTPAAGVTVDSWVNVYLPAAPTIIDVKPWKSEYISSSAHFILTTSSWDHEISSRLGGFVFVLVCATRPHRQLGPDSELNSGWCDSRSVLLTRLCASFCPMRPSCDWCLPPFPCQSVCCVRTGWHFNQIHICHLKD